MKKVCPNCNALMEWTDGQWFCHHCITALPVDDRIGYCLKYMVEVDYACYHLWMSVCHLCPHYDSCYARRRGASYEQVP